jgi:hypothetical protein
MKRIHILRLLFVRALTVILMVGGLVVENRTASAKFAYYTTWFVDFGRKRKPNAEKKKKKTLDKMEQQILNFFPPCATTHKDFKLAKSALFWEITPCISVIYSDWLRAGRSGDRIPVVVRFFSHVQTGPGTHPASCTMCTGYFPGVKRPGRGADHPHLLAPRSRKSRAIPLPPSGPSGLLGVPLPLPYR